jgi:hypothetical protein
MGKLLPFPPRCGTCTHFDLCMEKSIDAGLEVTPEIYDDLKGVGGQACYIEKSWL